MNHATIWAAIDRVAIRLRMTRSGLARHCGIKVMLFAHLSPEEFGRIISEAEHDLAQQNGAATA